jgi:hypothetical protein
MEPSSYKYVAVLQSANRTAVTLHASRSRSSPMAFVDVPVSWCVTVAPFAK